MHSEQFYIVHETCCMDSCQDKAQALFKFKTNSRAISSETLNPGSYLVKKKKFNNPVSYKNLMVLAFQFWKKYNAHQSSSTAVNNQVHTNTRYIYNCKIHQFLLKKDTATKRHDPAINHQRQLFAFSTCRLLPKS